ncbi:MAG: GTP-binding protein [Candidatus Thorarchaeota archaeon]|nr:GTP-binding protein [Candidatus Thorarchaeota archaeon]
MNDLQPLVRKASDGIKSKLSKVVFCGSGGVGKTCIVSRLVTGSYIEPSMTIGVDIDTWEMKDNGTGNTYRLVSCDLGGQSQFRFFQQPLIAGAKMAILVFDMSRYESFLELEEWIEMTNTLPAERRLIVGNKSDMDNSVNESDVQELSQRTGLKWVPVSALTGFNFDRLERMIFEVLRSDQGT